MACILDGTYTFVEGFTSVDLNYDESFDYSNLVLTLNGVQYGCCNIDSYDDGNGVVTLVVFADSYDEETEEYSYPRFELQFYPTETNLSYFVTEEEGTYYDGEATISICEKESDGSCPDIPLADSIPDKYADYIDANGNFVPKASSGGDCPFDIINVSIIDETENVYAGDAVKIAHLISEPFSGIVSAVSGGNEELQAIAYNGKALLFADSNSVSITLNPISNAQPAGSPGYLYITGDVSITIKDKGGAA